MAPAQEDDSSLLHVERISQYVSLSPATLPIPHEAVCASIFSPLLLSYFPAGKGVVLAYQDVELSASPPRTSTTTTQPSKKSRRQTQRQPTPDSDSDDNDAQPEPLLLRHVDEYYAPYLWATASFLIFRPRANVHITGHITHQSRTHITLAYLNTFPVSITRDHFPDDWTWHTHTANKIKKGWDGRLADEGGWWLDGEGVKQGGELRVRIRDYDGRMDGKGRGKAFLRLEGSLVGVEEERERERVRRKGGKGKERVGGGGVVRTLGEKRGEMDGDVDGEVIQID